MKVTDLRSGNKYYRQSWDKGVYVLPTEIKTHYLGVPLSPHTGFRVKTDDAGLALHLFNKGRLIAENWSPSIPDLTAEDWILYKGDAE